MNIESSLFHFMQKIDLFEKTLSTRFDIKDQIYGHVNSIFPRQGEVFDGTTKIRYRFHGSGCNLLWDGLDIDYDIDQSSVNRIKVSPWKFNKFLKSVGQHQIMTEKQVLDRLIKLEEDGVFVKRKEEDLMTFTINNDWYEKNKKRSII